MISVGIDIGTYSIKIAELESTSRSYVIRRLLEFPFSLDLTKDKKIEVIDTLRTLFSNYNLDKTQFVFAIPQNAVFVRPLNFPFRERFKVQKAVVSQLEDELPFPPEDAIFETKITRFVGRTADVLAMAAPTERVREILNLAHDCGVEPMLISTETMALANLFERWDEPPQESPAATSELPAPRTAEAVLNIGHSSTEMLIYADRFLVSVRHLDWGAKHIADAIGQKYGLNYIQAMRELQTKGFLLLEKGQATKEQLTFSQTIERGLAGLVGDMRLKMLEAQSEFNLQWQKAWLTGGGSELRNVGAFLTQQFEIPFNRLKQFDLHPAIAFETNNHIEMVTPIAIGLAIEGLRRPRNPATNFLKGEFAHQSHVFENLWNKWGYAAQIAGIAFVIFVVYGFLAESLSMDLAEESGRALRTQAEAIAGLKGSRAGPSSIRKFLTNVEQDAKNRKQAEKVVNINSALDIFNSITAAFPSRTPGLDVKRVSVDNEIAEVHGYTNSASDRDQVLKVLARLANGRTDSISPQIAVPAGKIPFAVKFKVQRYSGG